MRRKQTSGHEKNSQTINVSSFIANIVFLIINVIFGYLNYSNSKNLIKHNNIEKRPIIMVIPQPFRDSDQYIIKDNIEGSLRLNYQFQISNVGETTAKNLRVLTPIFHGRSLGESEQTSGPFEIPPKEKIFIHLSLDFKLGEPEQERKSYINSVLNGENEQILKLIIEYYDDFNSGTKYRSVISLVYNRLKAPVLLSSEYSSEIVN